MQRPTVIAVWALLSILSFAQTTTPAAEQADNTSGCASGDSHCYGPFAGMADNQITNTGGYVLTRVMNTAPANIAGPSLGNAYGANSIRTLLPVNASSSSTKIMVHFMPWFDEVTAAADHVDVGYNSLGTGVVAEQLRDIQARGYDGVIIDWNGGPNTCRSNSTGSTMTAACPGKFQRQNNVAIAVRDLASTYSQTFAIMVDQNGFNFTNNCAQGGTLDSQSGPRCVQAKIEKDLAYIRDNYFNHPNYFKTSSGSTGTSVPVVFTYIDEGSDDPYGFENCTNSEGEECPLLRYVSGRNSCTSKPECWSLVWQGIRNTLNAFPEPPLLIFRGGDAAVGNVGFRHGNSSGSIAWVQPQNNVGSAITSASQLMLQMSTTTPDNYLDRFYQEAVYHYPSKLGVAAVYKGFDDAGRAFNQSGGTGRVMSQKCGMSWLQSWNSIALQHNSSAPVRVVQVATWNDYDEGTAIEPGIDNCFQVDGAMGTTEETKHTWYGQTSVRTEIGDERIYASTNTIDRYVLYARVPEGNGSYYYVASIPGDTLNPTFTPGACDMTGCPAFVKMVGKPGIINRVSSIFQIPVNEGPGPPVPPEEIIKP